MKIKFSKTLAVILAVASITAMTGITALADITGVVTTTTYDYSATEDPTVEVKSTVKADEADGEVTYLVIDKEDGIKFIDQKTLVETEKAGLAQAEFVFKAKQSAIYDAELEVVAKFGTDVEDDFEMPVFKFDAGLDYFTDGKPEAKPIEQPTFEGDFSLPEGLIIWGEISGNVTDYGVKLTYEDQVYDLPAYGTIDGQYAVVINGSNLSEDMFTVYAK